MKRTAINPFRNRNKVTDPAEFFGRHEELEYLENNVFYPEPQSVAIIGERRIGKSSLMTYLHYKLSRCKSEKVKAKKLVSVFFDPEEIATDYPEDLTWVILDELISQKPELAGFVHYYPKDTKQEHACIPQRKSRVVLKNLLKEACENGYRFVFLIDEFELLARNTELRETGFMQYLRGISDNYALALVTSSRKPLGDIIAGVTSDGSPFDNNFSSPLHLGLLKELECRELVEGMLQKVGRHVRDFS